MGAEGMGLMSLFGAAGSLFGAQAEADALELEGKFKSSQYETNAKFSEMAADEALRRGDEEASGYKKKVKGFAGKQRASLAAQGVDVNSGSAAEIQDETKEMGEMDVLKIKNNAWKEAWGHKVQAQDYRSQAAFARSAAAVKRSTTLLTGGMKAIGQGAQAGYYFSK
jgi:hypothetical protein